MKCPNCGRNMVQDHQHTFCLFCGYMDQGVQIKRNTEIPASDVEIYLGQHYDDIYRNRTNYIIFFLGPFYFCYRKYILLGVCFFFLDLILYSFSLLCFPEYSFFVLCFVFFILRIAYMSCANILILKLAEKKVRRIRKKYGEQYLEELRRLSDHSSSSFFQLVIGIGIILLVLFFIFLFIWKKNGLL